MEPIAGCWSPGPVSALTCSCQQWLTGITGHFQRESAVKASFPCLLPCNSLCHTGTSSKKAINRVTFWPWSRTVRSKTLCHFSSLQSAPSAAAANGWRCLLSYPLLVRGVTNPPRQLRLLFCHFPNKIPSVSVLSPCYSGPPCYDINLLAIL